MRSESFEEVPKTVLLFVSSFKIPIRRDLFMRQGKKVVVAALIACMVIALLSAAAMAEPALSPTSINFYVGDTAAAGRQAITLTDPSATSWEWKLTDPKNKFALYSSATGGAPVLPGSTISGMDTIYIGVQAGKTLDADDIGHWEGTQFWREVMCVTYYNGGTSNSYTSGISINVYPKPTFSPHTFNFKVGDTSSAGRKSLTGTDPNAVSWEWTLVDPTGKFEIYDSATGTAVPSLTQAGTSSTIYVGIKPGAVLEISDVGWFDGSMDFFRRVDCYTYYGGTTNSSRMQWSINVYESFETPGLADLADSATTAAEVTAGLDSLGGLAALEENPANFDYLETLENIYASSLGITNEGVVNSTSLDADAVGLPFNVTSGSVKLEITTSAAAPVLNSAEFDTTNMLVVDIDYYVNGIQATPSNPIMFKFKKPAGLPDDFVVLHYTDSNFSSYELLRPTIWDGYCYIRVSSFSPFVFTGVTGGASPKGKDNTPAPIVPVLYDFAKIGDTFTFTTVIANANSNMSGATVEVKLNEKYATIVTIGADGFGKGTIEAPGFTGNIANFSARVNGTGVSVTKTMLIYTNGRVVPKG